MIAWIFRCFSLLLQKIALGFVHAALEHLPNDVRQGFVRSLIEVFFRKEPDASLGSLVSDSGFGQLMASQREQLFVRNCQELNAANTSQVYIDAFEAASGGRLHYSQEGEDIVLLRFLSLRRTGFFVDIGAHHATRFSNTFALYRKGWHGINIDAAPDSMKSFRDLRPRDINLERAISDKKGPLLFNIFREGALNTFNPALAESYKNGGFEVQETVELIPCSLADVLDCHLPEGQHIDLLSIDVEGEEMGVLRSNNWEKYCPDVIIIEALDTPLISLQADPTVVFLAERGFVPVARLTNSIILRRQAGVCAA
jgi:FkbM family methyltransferase